VDDVAGRQAPRSRSLGATGLAAAEAAALIEDLGPAGAVNRAVDAAAPEQGAVRRVDDRIRGELRDVALREFDPLEQRPGA